MQLIDQSHKILTNLSADRVLEMFKTLELAGRVCYKSEDKIEATLCPYCSTDPFTCRFTPWHLGKTEGCTPLLPSCFNFIGRILKRGHESVIEHASITVKFITDRGVTHEEVRHRLSSYSQESTRYCNYSKGPINFIQPIDYKFNKADLAMLEAIEKHYNGCLDRGLTPQQARYFLPCGLKTEIIHTANLRQWRHILNLRTAKAAHPQIRDLMTGLLIELQNRIPLLFDDIDTK